MSELTFGSKKRSLLETAALIAYVGHAGQVRKDDGSPYIIHPYLVAMKLRAHGFADRVIAAALLHDVLEDTQVDPRVLTELVGPEVVALVQDVTEDKSFSWEERKARYIERLRGASEEAKAVSLADKIHNLESLLSAHTVQGSSVWSAFSRGKEPTIWYHRALLTLFQETWDHPLVMEYAALVARLEALD